MLVSLAREMGSIPYPLPEHRLPLGWQAMSLWGDFLLPRKGRLVNLGEKRRAEQMVHDWYAAKRSPHVGRTAKPHPEPPEELLELGEHLAKKARRAHFRVRVWGESISFEHTGGHPALKAWNDEQRRLDEQGRSTQAESVGKRDRLIAEVWNGDHTFETLKKALDEESEA